MIVIAKSYEFRKQDIKESKKGNKYLITTWLSDEEKTIDIMTELKNMPNLEKSKKYDLIIDFNTYYKSLKIVDLQPSK